MKTEPSELAMVPFVSVDHMMGLILHIGIEQALLQRSDTTVPM